MHGLRGDAEPGSCAAICRTGCYTHLSRFSIRPIVRFASRGPQHHCCLTPRLYLQQSVAASSCLPQSDRLSWRIQVRLPGPPRLRYLSNYVDVYLVLLLSCNTSSFFSIGLYHTRTEPPDDDIEGDCRLFWACLAS